MEQNAIKVSSEEESDGQSAKWEVEKEEELEQLKGGKHGPPDHTRKHFHEPVKVVENGRKKWAFKCKYCTRYASK